MTQQITYNHGTANIYYKCVCGYDSRNNKVYASNKTTLIRCPMCQGELISYGIYENGNAKTKRCCRKCSFYMIEDNISNTIEY